MVPGARPERIEAATGCPARDVIITSTHTHTGPDTFRGCCSTRRTNQAYIERLETWLIEGAKEGIANARPARVGWGLGRAHIGYKPAAVLGRT